MKVLMFGWEFPPKIYGGLAVASYGITKGLSLQNDVETTFCLPKPTGEEEGFLNIMLISTFVCHKRQPQDHHIFWEEIPIQTLTLSYRLLLSIVIFA